LHKLDELFQAVIGDFNNADIGVNGAKGVIGSSSTLRFRERVEER
jgi:hypothetical protein